MLRAPTRLGPRCIVMCGTIEISPLRNANIIEVVLMWRSSSLGVFPESETGAERHNLAQSHQCVCIEITCKVMPAGLVVEGSLCQEKHGKTPAPPSSKRLWRCCSLENQAENDVFILSFQGQFFQSCKVSETNRALELRLSLPACVTSIDLRCSSFCVGLVHIPQPRTSQKLHQKSCLLIHNCPNA